MIKENYNEKIKQLCEKIISKLENEEYYEIKYERNEKGHNIYRATAKDGFTLFGIISADDKSWFKITTGKVSPDMSNYLKSITIKEPSNSSCLELLNSFNIYANSQKDQKLAIMNKIETINSMIDDLEMNI